MDGEAGGERWWGTPRLPLGPTALRAELLAASKELEGRHRRDAQLLCHVGCVVHVHLGEDGSVLWPKV